MFAPDITADNVVTSDGEGYRSVVDSEAVYRVVEAGVRHNLVLAQMEDVDTASLSADVETVLLALAQTSDFSRNIPGEDEPGL